SSTLYSTHSSDVVTTLLLSFSNHPAPTEISPLSLHDALPICFALGKQTRAKALSSFGLLDEQHVDEQPVEMDLAAKTAQKLAGRSEEHTSELQSLTNLVCRLLLEKKKKHRQNTYSMHVKDAIT